MMLAARRGLSTTALLLGSGGLLFGQIPPPLGQSPPRAAANLAGEWAAHRCAGCATGACVPQPTTYGYYPAVWRRWPTTAPTPVPEDPVADTPEAEVPGALDESRFRGRTRSDAPINDGVVPETAPEPATKGMPGETPFRTIPEEEVPDFDLGPMEGPAGGGGALDDLDVDADVDDFFDFRAVEPADDEEPPGLDPRPDELDLPPFGRHLRSPKRLVLNVNGEHPPADRSEDGVARPSDAASMHTWVQPRTLPRAPLDGSLGGPSPHEDVLTGKGRTNRQIIDQVAYQGDVDADSDASSRPNPLRSRRQPAPEGRNHLLRRAGAVQGGDMASSSSALGHPLAESDDTVPPPRAALPPPQQRQDSSARKNPLR